MQYLGGKSKIRKQVATFLEAMRQPKQEYLEPFVGGGWVLQEMTGVRYASDGNIALIAMYKALQLGWEPPVFVSEEDYNNIKMINDVENPMTAFCGVGCSFGGKWFGGYARYKTRNYAAESRRNILKQLPLIKDVIFSSCDYRQHSPENMLVYCDPPYESTTSYGAFDGFDHSAFWETMRQWSENNTVVISEYSAPDDFICMAEFSSRMGLTTNKKRPVRQEKLFMRKPEWLR